MLTLHTKEDVKGHSLREGFHAGKDWTDMCDTIGVLCIVLVYV